MLTSLLHASTAPRGSRCVLAAIVLLVVVTAPAYGVDHGRWYSESYRGTAGLPSGVINAIAEDKAGYLWLATSSGLVRFDGGQFTTWGTRGEPALPSQNVMSLLVTHDGSLWVGFTDGGVSRILNDRLVNYSAAQGVIEGFVITLLEARDGAVWMGGRGGVATFQNGRWRRIDASFGLPATAVYCVYEDRAGNFWIATAAGVFRRPVGRERFDLFTKDLVRDFGEDAAGTIWGTDSQHAVRALSPNNNAEYPISAMGLCLFNDRFGGMWIGTMGQGLLRASTPDKGELHGRLERITDIGIDNNEVVLAIAEDSQRNIWVATRSGLLRFFEHDVTMITRRDGLMNNAVRAIEATPDGSIWVGTVDGLDRFSPGNMSKPVQSYALPGLQITALHADRSGHLWVGTESQVGRFLDGKFVPVELPATTPTGRVFTMTTEADGALWLCGFGATALSRWDRGMLTVVDGNPDVRGRACNSAYTDARGRVWLGFSDGHLTVKDAGRFTSYTEQDGLPGGSVSAIHGDSEGTLWIGSTNGLSRFRDGRFDTISDRNGLPGRDVHGIVEDQHGYLWMVVGSGILRLDKRQIEKSRGDRSYQVNYLYLDRSDGLLESPTRYGSPVAARGGDGTLWFETVNGIAVVNPDRLHDRPPAIRARIERVLADSTPVWPLPEQLTLKPGTVNVEIDYTAVSLSAARKATFSYKLEGFDADWIDARTRRQAFYTRLPPGQYQFHVRAKVNATQQSETVWPLTIQPRIYQRSWFYALVIAAIALLAYGIWQLRMRALRRQFALVLTERTRIGREVHDTLLQSMAGMALQLESVAKRLDAVPSAIAEDLRHLRRQAQQHVREARELIWDLRRPQYGASLVAELGEFVETAGGQAKVRCQLTVEGEARPLPREWELEIFRIAQEAVRNAVRHSDASNISVRLTYTPADMSLSIVDDGRGFRVEDWVTASSGRWGLLGMRERAEKIGAELRIVSSHGAGTEVSLRIAYESSADVR